MPRVFLPQILWHSKDNKRCDRVYSIDFQPNLPNDNAEKPKNTTVLRLATGGADEFVHIWQITIQDLAPQYTHFVNNSQNSDNKVEFEQPLSIKILARLVGHIGEVNSVRWSHDGRVLASGGEGLFKLKIKINSLDRCIFLWVKAPKQSSLNEDMQGDYEEHWTRTHYFRLSNVVNSICWCPDDRVLSVSTEDGHVSLVDTQVEGTGKIRYFDGHTNFAQGVSLDPKNELLASLGSDQCLRIWKRRNQKQWKSVLVLKAARDRGDLVSMIELETNYELRKYSRYVFMSEELKTFFRRLDWSPDGRLLVAPTGIRYDKNNLDENGSVNNLDSTVYTLYIFHRKLLNLGIPMITHQSPTGPFVVVKFCPIYLSIFDKKRENFYNLLLNAHKNKMKPMKRKYERSDKTQPHVANKINAYFTSVNHPTNGTTTPTNKTSNTGSNLSSTNKTSTTTSNTYRLETYFKRDNNTSNTTDRSNNEQEVKKEVKEEQKYRNDNDVEVDKVKMEEGVELMEGELGEQKLEEQMDGDQEFEKMDDQPDDQDMDENESDVDMNNMDEDYLEEVDNEANMLLEDMESELDNEQELELDDRETVLEENDTNLDNVDSTTTRTHTETSMEYGVNRYSNVEYSMNTESDLVDFNTNMNTTSNNNNNNNTNSNTNMNINNTTDTTSNNNNMDTNMDSTSNYEEFPTDLKVDTTTTNLEESLTEVTSYTTVDSNNMDSNDNNNMNNTNNMDYTTNTDMDNEFQLDNEENKSKEREEQEQEFEKMDDQPDDQDMDFEEDMEEGENRVKNELDSQVENENMNEDNEYDNTTEPNNNEQEVKKEVKEEQEQEGENQGRYNFRKTRKSVIPMLFESTIQAKKKMRKTRVKKEKKEKLKLEEDLQEEDYDTDLEEELSIPRFLFAAGTTDGSLCFFDTKEKTGPIAVLKNLHFCPITDISWSPDGYVCASSSSDGYITFVIFNKRELS